MRLENAHRIQSPIVCFVCMYAGRKLEVWPIEPGEYIWIPANTESPVGREWRTRIKNLGDAAWPARWTGKRAANICSVHAAELYKEWELIGQLEVDLDRAINQYEQRQDERKELYG